MLLAASFAGPVPPDFVARASVALDVLAGRPGFCDGGLGRAADDPDRWLLWARFGSAGQWRRALGSVEAKLHVAPLLGLAEPLASAFETLIVQQPGGAVARTSDRSAAADRPAHGGDAGRGD